MVSSLMSFGLDVNMALIEKIGMWVHLFQLITAIGLDNYKYNNFSSSFKQSGI